MEKYLKIFIAERFFLHFFGGLFGAYLTTKLFISKFDYDDFPKLVGMLVMGFIFWRLGSGWEYGWGLLFKAPWSWGDIRWTAIGGFLGSGMYYVFPNSNGLTVACYIILGIVLVNEVATRIKLISESRKAKKVTN